MKKIISFLLTIVILTIPSFTAFAAIGGETVNQTNPTAYDCTMSDEEFEKLEHVDSPSNNITTYANNIIEKKTLSLAKSGNYLIIKATTSTINAKKTGFTYIKLQQYKNSKWVDYKVFEDLYSDSTSYSVTKSVTAPKGYKYRVVAKHYAKKSLLSVEKIENSTPALLF